MSTAIFEILFLLTISCLIGIFFTYRFWKSKFKVLENEKNEVLKRNESLAQKLQKEEEESTKLRAEITRLKEKPAAAAPKKQETQAPEEVIQLKSEIELLNEQMNEKEREIEALSKELDRSKISYYKQIDGKRYKALTIVMADQAIEGQGDGRISKEDAEKIFATISDGQAYTQVEKDTMRYLRDNYNWTEGADHLFRTKVRSWAAKGHNLDS